MQEALMLGFDGTNISSYSLWTRYIVNPVPAFIYLSYPMCVSPTSHLYYKWYGTAYWLTPPNTTQTAARTWDITDPKYLRGNKPAATSDYYYTFSPVNTVGYPTVYFYKPKYCSTPTYTFNTVLGDRNEVPRQFNSNLVFTTDTSNAYLFMFNSKWTISNASYTNFSGVTSSTYLHYQFTGTPNFWPNSGTYLKITGTSYYSTLTVTNSDSPTLFYKDVHMAIAGSVGINNTYG